MAYGIRLKKKKRNCKPSAIYCVGKSVRKEASNKCNFSSLLLIIFSSFICHFQADVLDSPCTSASVTFHCQEGGAHRVTAHEGHPAAVPQSEVLQQQKMPAPVFKVNHLRVFCSFGRFIINQPVVIVALGLGKIAFKQGFPSFHGFHILQALDNTVLG